MILFLQRCDFSRNRSRGFRFLCGRRALFVLSLCFGRRILLLRCRCLRFHRLIHINPAVVFFPDGFGKALRVHFRVFCRSRLLWHGRMFRLLYGLWFRIHLFRPPDGLRFGMNRFLSWRWLRLNYYPFRLLCWFCFRANPLLPLHWFWFSIDSFLLPGRTRFLSSLFRRPGCRSRLLFPTGIIKLPFPLFQQRPLRLYHFILGPDQFLLCLSQRFFFCRQIGSINRHFCITQKQNVLI